MNTVLGIPLVLTAILPFLAREPAPVPALSVEVCEEPCGMEDRVEVTVRIENRGKVPFYFYSEFSWGSFGYLDFEVFRQDGTPVPSLTAIDDWTFDAYRKLESDKLLKLDPGESIETIRKFHIKEFVDRPGKYRMMVRYLSRAPWSTFEGLPVWGRDAGPILGSTWFEVRDRPN